MECPKSLQYTAHGNLYKNSIEQSFESVNKSGGLLASRHDVLALKTSETKTVPKMGKHFCTGSVPQANAFTMAIVTLLFGAYLFSGGIYFLYFRVYEKTGYFVMGLLLTVSGLSLLLGIVQERKKFILFYLILGSTGWFVVTVFIINHELNNHEWKKRYRVLFLSSLFLFLSSLWCCQFSVCQFYKKLAHYDTIIPGSNDVVNSRISESTLILE